MVLRPDNEASVRVTNWVTACTRDVRAGDAGSEVLIDVIEVLQDYVAATKVGYLVSGVVFPWTDTKRRVYPWLFSIRSMCYSQFGMVWMARRLS